MSVRSSHLLIAVAAVLLAIATGLGAYASHGLDDVLAPAALNTFEIGIQYQFVHALGLIGVALAGQRLERARLLTLGAALLIIGTILFCGGLYTSSLEGPGWIVSLAPAGGSSLILGWLAVAVAAGAAARGAKS
ncbi:MAG: DUF423 domain-containing protein [Gammaproteobacteria bacterium]|nr:DUF423 domain-containing protein [Gammaproteobacteria bacterium]